MIEAPAAPDVSISVVSYNTCALVHECLEAIARVVRGVTYEVLVVDNASEDGSADLVARQFLDVQLLRNDANLGFAAANNRAIAASRGRYVLLLNTDAVPFEGSVEHMARYLDSHPDVGIVGGQLRNSDGTFQGSYMRFPSLLGEALLATKLSRLVYPPQYPSATEQQSQTIREADWVSGAFLMVRRAAIDDVGSMDESYFMYTEETDWCYRMRRQGWRVVYLPEARATHLVAQSSHRAPERRRTQVYRSKWLFMQKHYGRATAATFRAIVRGASAAKLLAWTVRGQTARPAGRAHAREQVRSYARLLHEL